MEKRSHIIQSIRNFKDIENQVNLDINRIVRNNFQLIKPKVTCVISNDNNDQLISSIKKEMKIILLYKRREYKKIEKIEQMGKKVKIKTKKKKEGY